MPELYYHPKTPRDRVPPGACLFLPTVVLKPRLEATDSQRVIPFLGAGASLPPVPPPALSPPQLQPSKELLDRISADLALDDQQARRFVEVSLLLAQLIQQRNTLIEDEDPQRAPSSWQLARRLAEMLSLEPLKPVGETLRRLLNEQPPREDYLKLVETVAKVLELSQYVPQLLTVASYFNNKTKRTQLVQKLGSRFESVRHFTPIQRVIGATAQKFVDAQNAPAHRGPRGDYLIITTNYDQLMEQHLMELQVPTCVLRVDRKTSNVLIDFMPGTQDFLKLTDIKFKDLQDAYRNDELHNGHKTAKNFNLANNEHSLAMVYKIHGCPISDRLSQVDNIVISDQDYITFIQNNGSRNELIPAYVRARAISAGFLFLGYSFSDWNVRSLYQQFVKSRQQQGAAPLPDRGGDDAMGSIDPSEDVDYIVIRSYGESEDYFFRSWRDISVIVTELDDLAAELGAPAPVASV